MPSTLICLSKSERVTANVSPEKMEDPSINQTNVRFTQEGTPDSFTRRTPPTTGAPEISTVQEVSDDLTISPFSISHDSGSAAGIPTTEYMFPSGSSAPEKLAPSMSARMKYAPLKSAWEKFAFLRFAPIRFASERLEFDKFAFSSTLS